MNILTSLNNKTYYKYEVQIFTRIMLLNLLEIISILLIMYDE